VSSHLVSDTANGVSKLRAGSYRRAWSSKREVSEASVRGAARVAHGVPSNRAGEDICKQSSSMALTLHDLIRATFAVSSRLLIAARGRCARRRGHRMNNRREFISRHAAPRLARHWLQPPTRPDNVVAIRRGRLEDAGVAREYEGCPQPA
jgi:hypothetical protein